MTSKTFDSANSSKVLTIESTLGGEVRVSIGYGDGMCRDSILLSRADREAIALAVLEAGGVKPVNRPFMLPGTPSQVENTAANLKDFIDRKAKAAKAEAEAKEKLEDEALKFFRVSQLARTDGGFASVVSFSQLSDSEQAQWIAVAEQHRKMAKEAQDA